MDWIEAITSVSNQDVQLWSAKRVFSRLRDQIPFDYQWQILRSPQVATLLSVDQSTVRLWAQKKFIGCKQSYYQYWFSLQDCADFLLKEMFGEYSKANTIIIGQIGRYKSLLLLDFVILAAQLLVRSKNAD